jgi:hypothetical protein
MRKIKGYVKCASTERVLSRFRILWYENNQSIGNYEFGSESDGFFEIIVPEYIKQIFIQKDNYSDGCITLMPNFNGYVAKITKT